MSGKEITIKMYKDRSKTGKELNPRETAGKYLSMYGENANKEFINSDGANYNSDFADEVISYLNEYCADSDKAIVRCKHCNRLYLWEESVWECEECGDTFCNECNPTSGETEKILCLDCK